MSSLDTLPEFCPKDVADWRRWLKKNHSRASGVWLIFYRAASGRRVLTYSEAVDEALCWGWIDSKVQPIDEERFRQVFTPRKVGSGWSALNKRKIEAMKKQGRMQAAGRAKIDGAIADGTWTLLDAVEALEMPVALQAALAAAPTALEYYESLTPGRKKSLLRWLNEAKREHTRSIRISRIIEALGEKRMPIP